METFIIVYDKKYVADERLSYGGLMSLWFAAKVGGLEAYLCAAEPDGRVNTRPLTREQAERLAILLRQRA